MGVFASIKAMKAIETMRHGGKAKISYAQISTLIINLQDAKRKFDSRTFNQLFSLYKEFQKCNTVFEVDLNGYYSMAIDVIKKFDQVAPFEKYSGGNELEFSFLLETIRNANDDGDFNENTEDDKSDKATDVMEDILIRVCTFLENGKLYNPITDRRPEKKSKAISRGALELSLYALIAVVNVKMSEIGFDAIYEWYRKSILQRNGNDVENANLLMAMFEMSTTRISNDMKWLLDTEEEVTFTRYHIYAALVMCKFVFCSGYPRSELGLSNEKEWEYSKRIALGEHFTDQFTHNVIIISDFLDELKEEI